MADSRRAAAIALLTVVIAGSALAQTLPPGKWWHRPEIANELSLSQDQQTKLDSIFAAAASDLIDAKAEQEKAEIALHTELEQQQPNRENVRRIVAHLNDARSRRFAREVMMLLDMRSTLTDQQWTALRARLDQLKPNGQAVRPRMRR